MDRQRGASGRASPLRSAARRLAELDASRAFIDLGGQVWAGAPPEHPWLVAVSHPRRRDEPVGRLALQDVSVATSGTSERPGHVLDPRTGTPSPPWGSVTVVSRDPVEADVLATALYVMGLELRRAIIEDIPKNRRGQAIRDRGLPLGGAAC